MRRSRDDENRLRADPRGNLQILLREVHRANALAFIRRAKRLGAVVSARERPKSHALLLCVGGDLAALRLVDVDREAVADRELDAVESLRLREVDEFVRSLVRTESAEHPVIQSFVHNSWSMKLELEN